MSRNLSLNGELIWHATIPSREATEIESAFWQLRLRPFQTSSRSFLFFIDHRSYLSFFDVLLIVMVLTLGMVLGSWLVTRLLFFLRLKDAHLHWASLRTETGQKNTKETPEHVQELHCHNNICLLLSVSSFVFRCHVRQAEGSFSRIACEPEIFLWTKQFIGKLILNQFWIILILSVEESSTNWVYSTVLNMAVSFPL